MGLAVLLAIAWVMCKSSSQRSLPASKRNEYTSKKSTTTPHNKQSTGMSTDAPVRAIAGGSQGYNANSGNGPNLFENTERNLSSSFNSVAD